MPLNPIVWFTGLPASGKTTTARCLGLRLGATIISGDEVRKGLCLDLGFSKTDRHENIRRIANVAVMLRPICPVIVDCITPTEELREMARNICGEPFYLAHCDCSFAECERRDPKGLYAAARAGKIANFTGVSAPFELPQKAIRVYTERYGSYDCAQMLFNQIKGDGQ